MRHLPSTLLGGLCLALALACGGTTPPTLAPQPAQPTITSFTGNGPLPAGANVTLNAVFAGGAGAVTPGNLAMISGVPLNAGPIAGTTTFTLKVTNPAGIAATATTTVAVTAASAALNLTIHGPAAGAAAWVRILGPGGFNRNLTASASLTGLVAGDYTLAPAGVWAAGQVYQAAGAGTVSLGPGATVSATVSYAPAAALTVQVPDMMKPGTAVPLELAPLPAGTFQMGAYDGEPAAQAFETPQHAVTLGSFRMARFPTTQALWKAVMASNPSDFSVTGGGASTEDFARPVERVSWSEITAPGSGFLALLNAATVSQRPAGTAFRLPTEAEWEYACRAGTTTRSYWGDDVPPSWINGYAWWSGNSGAASHPVGSLGPGAANAFGLVDMNGNVFQWCQDWYGPYAAGTPTDPAGPATGSYRVVRGGSWFHAALYCRSANRSYSGADDRFSSIGFRVVLAATP
jgi:formylglycine-generating enzyme required for sulfatase activity